MKHLTETSGSTAQAQLLTERPAWKALEAHCTTIRNLHPRRFFADNSRRGEYTTAMEWT